MQSNTTQETQLKPSDYSATYFINRETQYNVQEGSSKGTHAGTGTLHVGRVVWTQQNEEQRSPGDLVSCYAEGVGIVSLNPASLQSIHQS